MALDIMMPFYGNFDHFRGAVNSVIAQTSPEWNLVIIDDVYPDPAPGAWAAGLDHPRVTYVRNDVNLGPSRNYNKAIGLAKSEYMVLMGCDDIMLPTYVERVDELLQRSQGASVVQPGVAVIDELGAPSYPLADRVKGFYRPAGRGTREYTGEVLARSLLRGNWTYFPSLVWKRELLLEGGFREDLDVVQDLAKLFEITVAGGTLILDDVPVFTYRRHSRSVSAVTGTDGTKFLQEAIFFGEAAETASQLGWSRAARAARAHVSSRLNALRELPRALVSGNWFGARNLSRHVLGLPEH